MTEETPRVRKLLEVKGAETTSTNGDPPSREGITLAQLRGLINAADEASCPDDTRVIGRFGLEQMYLSLEWNG